MLLNGQKIWAVTWPKEIYEWPKKRPTSVARKRKLKPHFTTLPLEWLKEKRQTVLSVDRAAEQLERSYITGRCVKCYSHFLTKLIYAQHKTQEFLHEIHTQEKWKYIATKTCTQQLKAALFITAPNWIHCKCLQTGEWTSRWWCSRRMGVHTLWFCLQKNLEFAKLFYGDKKQVSGGSGQGLVGCWENFQGW